MLLSKPGQSAACKQASAFRQPQDHTQQILHARPFSGRLAALICSSRAYALRGYQQNTPRACYSVRRTLPTPDLISHLQNKKPENSNRVVPEYLYVVFDLKALKRLHEICVVQLALPTGRVDLRLTNKMQQYSAKNVSRRIAEERLCR